MLISDMISEIKKLNRCEFDDETVVGLLSDIDEKIYNDIIKTHEGAPTGDFIRYDDPESEEDRKLIAPGTYSALYRYYCDAEIYLFNGETDKSNSSTALFNAMYNEFAAYYHRTHRPILRNHFIY